MPYVQAIELIQDERDQLEHLAKHAKHWRERQSLFQTDTCRK